MISAGENAITKGVRVYAALGLIRLVGHSLLVQNIHLKVSVPT